MEYVQGDFVKLKELVTANQLKQAREIISKVDLKDVKSHEFLYLSFNVLVRLNENEEALAFLHRAYQLSERVDYYLILLSLYLQEFKFEKARALYHGSSLNEVMDYKVQLELGNFSHKLSDYRSAEKHYKNAIELNPSITALHNLAAIYRFLGKRQDALNCCKKANEKVPMQPDIVMLNSGLSTKTKNSNNIFEIKKVIDSNRYSPIGQAQLHFSMAKELEDIGEFDNSFRHLSKGNQIYRKTFDYNLSEDLKFIDQIKTYYTRKNISKISSKLNLDEPIFILGMPRTGSTLVERILSSHSEVDSAGELNQFVSALMYTADQQGLRAGNRIDMVKETLKLDFKRLGERYLETVDPLYRGKRYFIDKMPQNSLFIGLIKSAIPNAKIILVERDPLDTCYAIYKQMFKDIYFFAYDLEELGNYYLAYHQLMQHWKDVLGDSIFTIKYEELINKPEQSMVKLLNYSGLSWEDSCRKFYDNESASTTASASQVRERLYSSSIGKWKNYQVQLNTLLNILQPIR